MILQVTHAGVSICNKWLAKAKGAKKMSTRITYLARGYWLPKEMPFVFHQKPKTMSKEDFIPITIEDVENIISKWLTSTEHVNFFHFKNYVLFLFRNPEKSTRTS